MKQKEFVAGMACGLVVGVVAERRQRCCWRRGAALRRAEAKLSADRAIEAARLNPSDHGATAPDTSGRRGRRGGRGLQWSLTMVFTPGPAAERGE
jgi:hypothetical protein